MMATALLVVSCKKDKLPEGPETPETPEVVSVTGVELDKTTLSLKEGETSQLNATVLPAEADDKDVEWSTDNDQVATVVDGLVTAVKEGTAQITVTTKDGGKTATCDVTVTKDVFGPTSVSIAKDSYKFNVGDEFDMSTELAVSGETGADLEIVWTSSDSEVAVVENNKIVAKKYGKVTIRAAAKVGDKFDVCEVNVYDLPTDIEVWMGETQLKGSDPEVDIEVGTPFTLSVKIIPETADQDAWTASCDADPSKFEADCEALIFKALVPSFFDVSFSTTTGNHWELIRFVASNPFVITPEASSGLAGTAIKITASEEVRNWSLNTIKDNIKMGERKIEPLSDGKSASVSLAMHENTSGICDFEYTVTATDLYGRSASCKVKSIAWKVDLFDGDGFTPLNTDLVNVDQSFRLYVADTNDNAMYVADWKKHLNAVFGSEGAYTLEENDIFIKCTFVEGPESYKIVISAKHDPSVKYEQDFLNVEL